MHELVLFSLVGERRAANAVELTDALAERVAGGNHFEIAAATAAFPMLDLLVAGDVAIVHWFAGDGAAGDQAVGNLADPPDEVTFPFGPAGETLAMPGSLAVDAATAARCIAEFAETLQRPTLVEWTQL